MMAKLSLKAARVNVNLTQEKAAEMLGISEKTLYSYENGHTFPTAPTIKKMCEVYAVEHDELIFFK